MNHSPVTGPLAGIRVLELGGLASAPFAGRLMADLGADVIKVEPPGGEQARHRGPFAGEPDPNASGMYLALNTNKRAVVVDPADASHRHDRLQPLIDNADIVLSNLDSRSLDALGIDLSELSRSRPELVVCSITPFGRSGPYASYAAVELTVSHAGGWAYQTPGASAEDDQPPLKVFGHQTDYHAGFAAAMVALAAFAKSERTGTGDVVDFSSMAHTAGMLEAALIAASYMGENPSRLGSRLLNPWKIFRCSDGLIFLVTVEQDQWERLVDFMGHPEWVDLGIFDTNADRHDNEDLLCLYIEQWTEQHTVERLWHEGQARRICFAPVFGMADLERQQHLTQRGFFHDVAHPVAGTVKHLGHPFRWTGSPGHPAMGPAPLLDREAAPRFGPGRVPGPDRRQAASGSSADPSRPLEGVRVVDMTWVWAGPYATMHLGFLGAEVIKIESGSRPGLGRRLPLHPLDVEPTLNTCAYFNQWEQGKQSVELDLADPEAIEVIKTLVAQSDVLVENFATGVMEKLGLGYDVLKAIKPDLIVASISGYGSEGPLATYMGYGPTTGPLSGITALTGYDGGEPRELGIAVGDPASGICAAFAVTAALVGRARTGEGCYIDVALWEAIASCAAEGWMQYQLAGTQPDRQGNHDLVMSPHNCYRTSGEDEWVSIACADDAQWEALAATVDASMRTELAVDPRFSTRAGRKCHEAELDELIGAWAEDRDRWQITRDLQTVGVAAFPSMSPQDLLADTHLEERGFFVRLPHAEVGVRTHTGPAWISSTSPTAVRSPAPLVGQHTAVVLAGLG